MLRMESEGELTLLEMLVERKRDRGRTVGRRRSWRRRHAALPGRHLLSPRAHFPSHVRRPGDDHERYAIQPCRSTALEEELVL